MSLFIKNSINDAPMYYVYINEEATRVKIPEETVEQIATDKIRSRMNSAVYNVIEEMAADGKFNDEEEYFITSSGSGFIDEVSTSLLESENLKNIVRKSIEEQIQTILRERVGERDYD